MKESRKGYDLLLRGGLPLWRVSSVRAGSMGGESRCSNLQGQSCLTLLF